MTPQLNARIRQLKIPYRMRKLPLSDEGYPVPWFVPTINGKPDFRGFDGDKFKAAFLNRRCWLCGETLGKFQAFVIGPMCMVNRINSEPPSHHECAQYAVKACPFLTQPRMRRNEKNLPEHDAPAGNAIKRNPGVSVIWTCLHYKPFQVPAQFAGAGRGTLFRLGEPVTVEFWREGRAATRIEVLESIYSGMPLLRDAAMAESTEAVEELTRLYEAAIKRVPGAEVTLQ